MYQYHRTRWTKHLDFIFIDLVLFEVAMFISVLIRFRSFHPADSDRFVRSGLILLVLILLFAILSNNYSGIMRRETPGEFISTLSFTTVIIGLFTVFLYIFKLADAYPRFVYICTWVLASVFIFFGRTIRKKELLKRPDNGHARRQILVITTEEEARGVLTRLKERRQGSYNIDSVAIVDRDLRGEAIRGIPVNAYRNDIFEYIRSTEIEEVFLHLPDNRSLATFFSDHLKEMGLTVHMSLSWQSESAQRNTRVEGFGGYTVLTTSARIVPMGQLAAKRAIDIAGSLVGMAICGVIYLFVAPIIKKQSPGPVIFAQERIGKNGKRFMLYKFRSMYPDAEERKAQLQEQNEVEDGLMFKIEHDPRVFPFGQFMRRTSLDEFPQFFNVFLGDMSLVGTRPPTVDEWEKYEYHYMKRLAIKPGITGLWQVSGRSDIKDFREVVALDTQYIDEWSIGLDIKILLKTVLVVLTKRGAS